MCAGLHRASVGAAAEDLRNSGREGEFGAQGVIKRGSLTFHPRLEPSRRQVSRQTCKVPASSSEPECVWLSVSVEIVGGMGFSTLRDGRSGCSL